ncbi:opioid growth factor receptor-like protein 1 [Anoplopoma fimbria]|uniref:opioid growth factor receptor-like protein 1 n=1 Tax=Anoplopoma fimbria TaxID=229290 RepID=UPI0023ED9B6D|nr:opioid growth factor receptor-like protein 1 [Anoplopoma fimbria]
MRTVSLLCCLLKYIFLLAMSVFNFNRLYSVYEWFRRILSLVWRCVKARFGVIVGYAFSQIRLLKGNGNQVEPDKNPEDRPTKKSVSKAEEINPGDRPTERSVSVEVKDINPGDRPTERSVSVEVKDINPGDRPTERSSSAEVKDINPGDRPTERSVSKAEEINPGDRPTERSSSAEFEDINPGDRPTERSSSAEFEESRPEGQHEPAAGKRAADPDRVLTCKRQRVEEGDGEFDGEEYRVQTTDELFCGYDSTWETEEPQRASVMRTRRPAAYNQKFDRFFNSARDMQNYRHDYPSQFRKKRWNQGSDDMPNLNFYLGMECSKPDGVYIQDFHDDWYGQYDRLERVHSYIQWLFPLQEPGMNYEASTLTKKEIEEFCENATAKANLLKSYKLMLDFYGIELCDEKTGEVGRASNWRERFNNLNSRTHNNLRITRILKCQGTLGFRHYQAPLVRFFLEETLVHEELPNVKESVLNYFVFAVLNKRERRNLIKFAFLSYDRKDEFVWCPKRIQMIWSQGMKGRRGNFGTGRQNICPEENVTEAQSSKDGEEMGSDDEADALQILDISSSCSGLF